MRFLFAFLSLVFISLIGSESRAQSYLINQKISREQISKYATYFIDSENRYTIEDFKYGQNDQKFEPHQGSEFPRPGSTSSTIWIRLEIINEISASSDYVIHFEDPSLFDIQQFEVKEGGGKILTQFSGTSVRAANKPISGNENAFLLKFDQDEHKVIYYRVTSSNFISLPISITSFNRFYNETRIQRLLLGIYYGAVIIIILLGFYLFTVFRKDLFIYYALSVFFLALITGVYDGITPEIFKRVNIATKGYIVILFSALSNTFSLLFMLCFLNLKRNAYRVYQITLALITLQLVSLLLALFNASAALELVSLLSLPVTITVIIGGIVGVLKKVSLSGYFLAAFMCSGIAVVIAILSLFDVITYNYYIKFTLHFGFLFNFLILALGLQGRIKLNQKELLAKEREAEKLKVELTEQKNRDLENQVLERTKDIRKQEINLRSILDNNTNDAIWLVDKNYRLIEFNTYMRLNFENAYNANIKSGEPVLEYITIPELKEEWKSRYDSTITGIPGIYFDEYPVLEGEVQHFQVNTYPIRNNDEIVGISVYARNITGLKLSEAELRKRNEELEKLNRELDRFVYSASHDLKAPLSSVLGLINIIKHEKDEDNRMELVHMMEKSIQKLNRFIKDIENYSRNTRTEVVKEVFNLKSYIESIYADLNFLDGAEDADKQIVYTGTANVISDKQRVGIILSNLINNALRYTIRKRGKDDAKVITRITVEEKLISISVEDNGPGIPPEHLDHIFDMFYRVHESVSGTGLGLYIVRETVEKLEGSIRVESEVDKGTIFHLELPNNS